MKAFSADFSFKLLLTAVVFSLFSQAVTAFPISENQEKAETIKSASQPKAFFVEEISANLSWVTENETESSVLNYTGLRIHIPENSEGLITGRFYHYFQDKKLLLKNSIFPFHFFW